MILECGGNYCATSLWIVFLARGRGISEGPPPLRSDGALQKRVIRHFVEVTWRPIRSIQSDDLLRYRCHCRHESIRGKELARANWDQSEISLCRQTPVAGCSRLVERFAKAVWKFRPRLPKASSFVLIL